ncbi:MAG TPA: substrate-binding domain-containing protein [Saprospiraceae bacterium]|nr:substrate-binding domain-containing protein [Saprospiraceae bacterium]HPI04966.1 substrate-binding domain-containing protein [Saprospiraceae bacterium]
MQQKIRIKDIAAQTGVSIGTVDRVLHNRGHVSPDVRARVLKVMEEMGYEPNMMARSLANNKKTYRIAVILPDYRFDPYWEQPKEGVERAAETVGQYGAQIEFHFFPLFEPKSYLDILKNVVATAPDGVLIAPLFHDESMWLIQETTRLGIPKVMINTQIEGTDALSYIGQDSYQSGVLAGRLLNFGLNDGDHAMVLNLDREVPGARHLQAKQQGFKDFFDRVAPKNIGIHTAVFEAFDDPVQMKAWAVGQLENNPRLKGFFVTNSRAYKLVEALDDRLATQIKIVGFDLIEPNLRLLESNKIRFLINQNAWRQGYLGVHSLVHHLILRKEIPSQQYLPLDIIVRENASYYLKKSLESPFAML